MYSTDQLLERIQTSFQDLDWMRKPMELYEPIQYTLELGGKRIRPLLLLLSTDLFDGNIDDAIPAAIGIEIFHNFTLLHDDIMDHATIRRGRETVVKHWDVNTAILSGDTMFALAYSHIARVPEKNLLSVLQLFSTTAREVCEGQQYDMNFESQSSVSQSEYMEMIRLKTAVLLACSLKSGAILANAPTNEADKIYRFGEQLGLAFQIQDDLLDTFGDVKTFGKEIGGDILAGKKTYLYTRALELSTQYQKEFLMFDFFSKSIDPLVKIEKTKQIFQELDIPAITTHEIDNLFYSAMEILDSVEGEDQKKEPMRQVAKSLMKRRY